MTPDQLMALAQRLLCACRDPATGEPLYPGESSGVYGLHLNGDHAAMHDTDSPHDDDQQQWRLVPVTPTPEMLAAVSWPGCAATDYAHMLAAAPQPPSAQPTLTAEIVERRLRTWRQRFVNRSGDQLALGDFLDRESLDDLVDFVCDEYSKEAKR